MAEISDKRGAYALARIDPIWPQNAKDTDVLIMRVEGELLEIKKPDFDEAVDDLYKVTTKKIYELRDQK